MPSAHLPLVPPRLVQVTSRGCTCLQASAARPGAPPQPQTKSLGPASTNAPNATRRRARAPVTTPSSVHYGAHHDGTPTRLQLAPPIDSPAVHEYGWRPSSNATPGVDHAGVHSGHVRDNRP